MDAEQPRSAPEPSSRPGDGLAPEAPDDGGRSTHPDTTADGRPTSPGAAAPLRESTTDGPTGPPERAAVPAQRPPVENGSTALTLGTPTDVVAALPYLVGEPPDPGIVVVALRGTRARAAFVADLARVPAGQTPLERSRTVVRLAAEEGSTGLVAVGLGPVEVVGPYLDGVVGAAREHRLDVHDALRVAQDRYWSHLCHTPGCCPPEGHVLDTGRSTVPAQAVLMGIAPAEPVRRPGEGWARLRALMPEPDDAAAAVMEGVTATVEQQARRMAAEVGEAALVRRGTTELLAAVRREKEGRGVTGEDELAWLGLHLTRVGARDQVWARLTREDAAAQQRLWARLTGRVCPRYRPAPAALLAVAAWQLDDEPLARAALDVALAADPGYGMAVLMRRALDLGLPVQRWRAHAPTWLDRPPDAPDPPGSAPVSASSSCSDTSGTSRSSATADPPGRGSGSSDPSDPSDPFGSGGSSGRSSGSCAPSDPSDPSGPPGALGASEPP
ncbi:DUF4192 domain-containing protein [Nocardiopsis sp. NRRL B-16309]|uniref:DUF4192 domain-containing protein n=1 Tax=Nocardiopsis sp. NRRL B-16309 TaxID=1519494 RepID=UPI0006ADED01|nr:DUF4192 domain-containing protein [Nocardiopsis sp. NRRL B-16309]KOX17532.1 hypothetical protein ADL05_09260 [Nocardiopsis sp. NRRL B-16309]